MKAEMARKYHQKRNKQWKRLTIVAIEHKDYTPKVNSTAEVQKLLTAGKEVTAAVPYN